MRLCESHPELILQLDDDGRTPLHLACSSEDTNNVQQGEVVAYLYQQAPEALLMLDSDGENCLFVAARFQPLSVLIWLLPPRGEMPALDNSGATLLHWACQASTNEVIAYLVRCYPDMVTQRAVASGAVPLHCAMYVSGTVEQGEEATRLLNNVKILVKASPRMLLVRDGEGETPLDLAQRLGASQELLDYLQAQQQEVMPNANENEE